MQDVYVVGTGVTPFGRIPRSLTDMALDAGTAALDDAGLTFGDIDIAYTGTITSGPATGVRVMQAFGLTGLPVFSVENMSATGLAAFHSAWMAIAGRHADVAMAVCFDNVDDGQSGGVRVEMSPYNFDESILPAAFFAMWTKERMRNYGTTAETLAQVAAKNWNHARDCAWAHRRADQPVTAEQVLASRILAEPITSMMATPAGTGAAVAILASPAAIDRLGLPAPRVRVRSSVLVSERYQDDYISLGAAVGSPAMTRIAAERAYRQAELAPRDIDLVQVHDGFPIEELLYCEALGICADGDADALLVTGDTTIGGRIPFSTDGGLIGRGHPGAPTGLAQIHETTLQLKGEAGSRQVVGAQNGLCQLVGNGSTCVVTILGAVNP